MKAAYIQEWGKPLAVRNIPKPSPGPGEVLVKIGVTGLCHTDYDEWRGDSAGLRQVMEDFKVKVVGHEGAGKVVEVGPGVELLKPGDRVGIPWMNYWDGKCEYCLDGHPHWCANARITSLMVNGTYAEYATVHERAAPVIPEGIPDDDAAPLLCAGVTAYGAVRKLGTQVGLPGNKLVAIVGAAGGLGHYGAQLAKAMGYKTIGIDIGAERIKFIMDKMALDDAVDASNPGSAIEHIKEKYGGVHAAIAFVPRMSGYNLAVKILRPTGTLIVVGVPADAEGFIPLTPTDVVLTGTKVIPSRVGVSHEFQELFDLYAEGKVKSMITRTYNLDEVNNAFGDLKSGRITGRAVLSI